MEHGRPHRHLLLLAGSGEAEALAQALEGRADWRVTVSHNAPPRLPWTAGLAFRVGGFGGTTGFAAYLEHEKVTAVLDATHPFATRISARTARVCGDLGLPCAQVLRPPWVPQPGDRWTEVPDIPAAAAQIAPGQIAFTTTGRATLAGFADHAGALLYVRRLRPDQGEDALDLPHTHLVPGTGPFSVEQEIALFKELHIDLLITPNAGGTASRSKLDAARALGLPVVMVARPPAPGPVLPDVASALAWLEDLS